MKDEGDAVEALTSSFILAAFILLKRCNRRAPCGVFQIVRLEASASLSRAVGHSATRK